MPRRNGQKTIPQTHCPAATPTAPCGCVHLSEPVFESHALNAKVRRAHSERLSENFDATTVAPIARIATGPYVKERDLATEQIESR